MSSRPDSSTAPVAPSACLDLRPRYDLYGPVHKALRAQLCDALLRVSRIDVSDEADRARACDRVSVLLSDLRLHLAHEEEFIHPLLETLQPGSAAPVLGEHDDHREAMFELELLIANLRTTPSAQVAHTVYRRLALLVAENLDHMEIEEGRIQELLWAHLTDAELDELNGRIVAHVSPQEFAGLLEWMLPALTPMQRAGMLGQMRDRAPAPVFEGVLGIARAHLDPSGWVKLSRALQLPAVPGLVSA